MLTLTDKVIVAVKVISDEGIDGVRVAEWLELLATFLRLAVALMLVIVSVVNALDALVAAFWQAWDAMWADFVGLRPKRAFAYIVPMG
jgi:hypothetical protein